MKVFSVFGITDSGKTTTVECIIKELTGRGYSVGSVKEIHYEKFTIDKEGTDTMRHRAAGAELVTARGLYETDILFKGKLDIKDILKFYNQDYVVLEGVRDKDIPKILCAHNENDLLDRIDDSIFAISGVISEGMNSYRDIPVINALTDIDVLVDVIEQKACNYTVNRE
jgi:molybdopterin-guanine dinucleotide biosynthesis protein B